MRYGITFTLLGVCWTALAVTHRGPAWLLLWPALAFLLVGSAYLGLGAKVFGKRPDGSMSAVHLLVLLPYVGLAWTVWALLAAFSKEAPAHEVSPGIWIGRRPRKRELPTAVELIIDLTCELWEPKSVRTARPYASFPTLDAAIPDLQSLIDKIRNTPGPILIHCAQGHGRSVVVAARLLLDRGVAKDPEDAIHIIAKARPAIRLNGRQIKSLRNDSANPM